MAHDTFLQEDIEVLKNGRHFRLPEGAKLVVGRNEKENDFIDALKNPKLDLVQVGDEMNAPSSLLSKNASKADEAEACRIILSFTKALPTQSYTLTIGERIIHASPYHSKDEAKKYLI